MKILTKAYNNTDWLNGTDLIIWNLDEQLIKEEEFFRIKSRKQEL